MKKLFAVIMAVAMVASMSAVAFAAPDYLDGKADSDGTVKVDGGKTYFPVVDVFGPFNYDADDKVIENETIEYGDTAYFLLVQAADVTDPDDLENGDTIHTDHATKQLVSQAEVVSGLKVKATWEEGKNLVSGVSIVKKKVVANAENDIVSLLPSELATSFTDTTTGYFYFLAISTTSSTSTSDADIIGKLTLSKSKHPKVDDLDLDISVNVGWANSYNSDKEQLGLSVTSDSVGPLDDETYYALKFDYDDEVDIEFEDGAIFTVDVSGQSKLLLYFDTKYNSKVANKYPLAELNFWNGNGAKFNRVGEMFIPIDEDYAQFLYMLNADGTLSEVPGAEYDEYDEGFYFNTRVLGTYVISDMELDIAPVVSAPVVTTPTPAPVVTNPSTGAAA